MERVLEEAAKDPLLKGVTLSGGEPFSQAKPLTVLAKRAHEMGLNVFCYTGYTFEKLMSQFDEHPEYRELLEQCDWLVDGPFIEEEIAVRYYWQEAGIRVRLRYDDQLREALTKAPIQF